MSIIKVIIQVALKNISQLNTSCLHTLTHTILCTYTHALNI